MCFAAKVSQGSDTGGSDSEYRKQINLKKTIWVLVVSAFFISVFTKSMQQ